jgi:hypothetical protein
MFAIANKKRNKIQMEQPQRRSICQDISPVSNSNISGRHCVNKIRSAVRIAELSILSTTSTQLIARTQQLQEINCTWLLLGEVLKWWQFDGDRRSPQFIVSNCCNGTLCFAELVH